MSNSSAWRLDPSSALLVVIDVQERLLPHIHDYRRIELNTERLIRGCHLLDVPAVVTEQYTKGLGVTTAPLRTALAETTGYEPIEKMCFSSFGSVSFAERLTEGGRRSIIVCGIEAHVCVYQTSMDLLGSGFLVYVVTDAVSSRDPENRDLAFRRLEKEGAILTSTEMSLFEMCVESGTARFKAISKLVR